VNILRPNHMTVTSFGGRTILFSHGPEGLEIL
jgi:hypothetical protein